MKVVKWIACALSGLVFLFILSLELFYQYRVHQLNPQEIHSQQQHATIAKEVLWVESTGAGNIELGRLTVTEYLFRILHFAATYSFDDPQNSHIQIKGLPLAMMASRMITVDDHWAEYTGYYHLNFQINQFVKTVWVTRNTTADELLGYILENVFFAHKANGLDKAAGHFFDKTESELSREEIIGLISMLKAPSRYHPQRFPKRFEKRAEFVAERLKANWPEKYGGYIFVPPTFSAVSDKKTK